MTDNALEIIKDKLARMPESPATKALSVAVTKLGETYPGEYGAIFKASNDEALTTIANILTNERESGKAVSGGKDGI